MEKTFDIFPKDLKSTSSKKLIYISEGFSSASSMVLTFE